LCSFFPLWWIGPFDWRLDWLNLQSIFSNRCSFLLVLTLSAWGGGLLALPFGCYWCVDWRLGVSPIANQHWLLTLDVYNVWYWALRLDVVVGWYRIT
jgi:hypothetical protein